MPLERILLVDRDAVLVYAWEEAFRDVSIVEARIDDYFAESADAMVSPANSFGIMDGGLDLAIRDTLGTSVERRLREVIERKHHGELAIGMAEIVATDHTQWPFLISAPTMRIPEDVSYTANAYWAFRAVLLAVRAHNASQERPIRSIICSGLGTGSGAMSAKRCALQMKQAWLQVDGNASLPSWAEICNVHYAMRMVASPKARATPGTRKPMVRTFTRTDWIAAARLLTTAAGVTAGAPAIVRALALAAASEATGRLTRAKLVEIFERAVVHGYDASPVGRPDGRAET